MNSCSFVVYLMIIFGTIANAFLNQTISNKYDNNDHRRSLQSSNSFSTAITKLTASNGEKSQFFGYYNGVAISNNRIVVGAWGYNNNQGAAYFFTDPNNPSTGRSYSQMAIPTANDGQSSDSFGISVDIDGDIIVVGATYSNSYKGAVYIFRIGNNNIVSQIAKLTEQNGAVYDYFGYSVVIHGNFILVGANGVNSNGLSQVGSAYLFVNPSNDSNNHEWTQIMQFQPNGLTEFDFFGFSVAMDDQIAVVGTLDNVNFDSNVAYVFVPVDENADLLSLWTQMAKLTGPTDSLFGNSVAVAGNTIVVGAPYDDNVNGNNAGAVFVFNKMDGSSASSSTSSWTQTNILLAADGAEGDFFGTSVSISKDASTIVVGASRDDYSLTITNSGSAYLFQKTTTAMASGWTQVGKFVATDRDTDDYLGSSIAVENSIVVVGAWGDNTAAGENAGSVHILDTGFSPTAQPSKNTGSGIPWNKIFGLAASGALILGVLGCLLL